MNVWSWFRKNPDIAPLPAILVLAFLVMALLSPGRYLSGENIQSMTFQLPELGLFSLAMMITLLSGGINLSVITTANVSSVLAALVFKYLSGAGILANPGLIDALAIVVALGSSLLLGFLNAFLIAVIGVSPILATLGTMGLYDGIAIVITRGYVISDFPKPFLFIGSGAILGIPVSLLVFVVCALLIALMLNRRPLGITIYMLGSNPTATTYSGIDVGKVLIKTYVISGLLSGVAAVVMTARFNSANAGYGASYMLTTVLIAVLGGVNPFGGFGKIAGMVLALVILQLISSGLNLLGVTAFVTVSMWGILLIIVMGFNSFISARRQVRISKQPQGMPKE
jgi:ribose/xylose/arabinose/galactoside ABC-type transport system permease subunit